MQQPMQQSMPQSVQQQDQLASQAQQMMLCPVRVVYETQILVQPGDQIQPNQTLFINPQNPPPWAQNRQVQNPVIYVQQMPNNMMPPVPQHIDQNQLYLQHYQNYPQMMPQQMMQQNQDPRAIQMPNMIPHHMVPNYQTNVGPNIVNTQERVPQQYGMMPNIEQGIQIQAQPQVNVVSNNMNRNDNNMQITQAPQQNQNSQRVNIKPPTFMSVGPQITQQVRPQPQVLTVNPIQNVSQASTSMQTMPTNVGQRQIQRNSVGSQISPPVFTNSTNSQSPTRIRKVLPTAVARVPNPNAIRNSTQTYRTIQPRPQQYRTPPPTYSNSIQTQTQVNRPIQAQPQTNRPTPNTMHNQTQTSRPTQNTNSLINIAPALPSIPTLQINQPSSSTSFLKTEENGNYKKRKSESPDDINKKMATIQVNISTPVKPVTMAPRTCDVGTPNIATQKNEPLFITNIVPQVPTANTNPEPMELTEINRLVENVQQAIQIDRINVNGDKDKITEKDKLIRNTVFTQARGRVLNDKENQITLVDNASQSETVKDEPSTTQILKNPTETVVGEIKRECNLALVKTESTSEVNNGNIHMTDQSVSLNTANNKGMLPVDRRHKQERNFVLTHVLDGIVIQESNIAFPIRDPGRRSFQSTSRFKEFNEMRPKPVEVVPKPEEVAPKPEEVEAQTTDPGGQTSQESVEDLESNKTDNPFSRLTHETLKSWTTEQLSSHLSKYKWDETSSLFLEHEIDGESLYLVSKLQLQAIGVKEEQADIICSFVKS